jgi:hypothetical protein
MEASLLVSSAVHFVICMVKLIREMRVEIFGSRAVLLDIKKTKKLYLQVLENYGTKS